MTQLNIELPPPKDSKDFDGWAIQLSQYIRDYIGIGMNQYSIPNTYTISTNTTITDDLTVLSGTLFSIPTGITLTITGSISAGLYKIFSCAGTGKVVLAKKTIYPEWWGALGDGSTDDSFAFSKMIESISGGATIILQSGKTYIIDGTTYLATYFTGLSNIVINGNKAILKVKPSISSAYSYGLAFNGCTNITVNDIQIDGNRANIADPVTGDGQGYGIWVFEGSSRITVNRAHIYDMVTDSVLIGRSGGTAAPSFVEVNNSRLYRARRNNVSITGATDVTVRNCQILSAGVTVGSSTGAAPKSGCDIEPDVADAGHSNERIRIIDNYFTANVTTQCGSEGVGWNYDVWIKGNKFLVDSGNGVLIGGAANYIWKVTDNIFNVASAGERALVSTTAITAEDVEIKRNKFVSSVDYDSVNIQDTGKARWSISDNEFKSNYAMLYIVPTGSMQYGGDFLVCNNRYISTGDSQSDDDPVVTLADCMVFNETYIRSSALTNHYRYVLGSRNIVSKIEVVGNKAVIYDNGTAYALPGSLIAERDTGILEFNHSAAPVAGTWAVNARVWNTAPAAAGSMGWVCTTAGTSGTWKYFGVIEA